MTFTAPIGRLRVVGLLCCQKNATLQNLLEPHVKSKQVYSSLKARNDVRPDSKALSCSRTLLTFHLEEATSSW